MSSVITTTAKDVIAYLRTPSTTAGFVGIATALSGYFTHAMNGETALTVFLGSIAAILYPQAPAAQINATVTPVAQDLTTIAPLIIDLATRFHSHGISLGLSTAAQLASVKTPSTTTSTTETTSINSGGAAVSATLAPAIAPSNATASISETTTVVGSPTVTS